MDPQELYTAQVSQYLFSQGECNSVLRIPAQSLLVFLQPVSCNLPHNIDPILSCNVLFCVLRCGKEVLLERSYIPKLVWRWKCVKLQRSNWRGETVGPQIPVWIEGFSSRCGEPTAGGRRLYLQHQLSVLPLGCPCCGLYYRRRTWQGYSTEVQHLTNPEMLLVCLIQLPTHQQG